MSSSSGSFVTGLCRRSLKRIDDHRRRRCCLSSCRSQSAPMRHLLSVVTPASVDVAQVNRLAMLPLPSQHLLLSSLATKTIDSHGELFCQCIFRSVNISLSLELRHRCDLFETAIRPTPFLILSFLCDTPNHGGMTWSIET